MLIPKEIKFVDLRFTDTVGKEQHITVPAEMVTAEFFQHGKTFDGSSIAGWREIHESDMILSPVPDTAVLDPFCLIPTWLLRCNIVDPLTMQSYSRCPRAVAMRAQDFLQSTGIADCAYFGPEPEFFIFNSVRWEMNMTHAFYQLAANDDSSQDLRSAICQTLEKMGLVVEAHHHEAATHNQNEICTQFRNLLRKADEIQMLKYVVHNVAHRYGKTATFMPKPMVGNHGSGMHCHQSLFKNKQNIFSGDKYHGLSDIALYYMGGILKHAKALNAFTNATTNSYKRLVPGFEAPVHLTYSAHNRAAAIRIPFTHSPQGKRIEVRFPDGATNPYLAFAAMLMAGIDGIMHKIHPGAPLENVGSMAENLNEALTALQMDCDFLKMGGVFSDDLIDGYIQLKMQEVKRLQMIPHPVEFELYYNL